MDLFTNQLFNAQVVRGSDGAALGTSGNAAFALSVARWALQDRGVLEAEGLQHRLVAAPLGSPAPSHYRVLDDVEFSVKLWEREAGARRPYLADDVQVEFTMLDPHVRLPLSHDGQGNFSVRFKVPDVYGVFKYVLTYRRPGYSYVDLVQQVVRVLLFGGILTGGVFSYSLFTSKLQQQGALITTPAPVSTEGDYGAVRSAVANILDKDDYDDGSFGPVLVRLAWHASGTYDKASNTGGSNGSTMR
ncbi:dolichyl-diphosphooligosaccharide--protein glycosyltransferase 48 kDa subunit [Haematococcus lacustris]|uniref:Dolichyl-diphosphooligosaccharide--protein glycosyltransferase 48 kDa subunit n=1 Tax=Haematococcus lacustris TaxID=44745 RepID=A0A699ZWC8_HAELA|nr:dolichyl-diphosphooligosaccharide--protein glycosyltransferase 48 kDa subunit [Haematococcus lacustris]